MKNLFLILLSVCFLSGCSKLSETENTTIPGFIKYTIVKGGHFADKNPAKKIETTSMKFLVKFDGSAEYTSLTTENQFDINKLFGFSDNDSTHHRYSARIGWRWSDGALRLFAYVYNSGTVISKEITTVNIGEELDCSISVAGDTYHFKVNDHIEVLPRTATTPSAKGYQLYPYFGGDEVAPHEIRIWIKEIL
ncbi:MAG: hypothetical protein H0U44_07685 [Flavisolibacter sp.]|jgi:hypothetical protein|nr:hypothetical protein [Flavisolibacter sp.]